MFSATCCSLVRHCSINMPWLEWCPDPQRPDAQWIKTFHPGAWTLQEERDDPPPRHTYREWKKFYDQVQFTPLFLLGTNGTGPRKVTGVSRLLNQTTTSLRLFPLISTAWPHSHRLCACLRRCWRRFYDPRMRRPSLLRISLVCRQGSASSLRIARVKHCGRINQCVLLEALILLNLLESLILICPQAAPAVLTSRRSPSLN